MGRDYHPHPAYDLHDYEVIGEVFGVTTQSKNVFSNIGAGLKNMVNAPYTSEKVWVAAGVLLRLKDS